MERRIEKGKITQEDMDSVLSRMHWSTDIEKATNSDFVFEAVLENMDLKKEIFGKFAAICSPETTLATNTTALSISEIASATTHPERVIGMHFFNPAVIMKLVEVIRGEKTSDETITTAKEFAESLGKSPITTAKEAPALNETVSIDNSSR